MWTEKKFSNIPWTDFFSLQVLNIDTGSKDEIRQGIEDFAKAMLSTQSLERLTLHGWLSLTHATVDYLAQSHCNILKCIRTYFLFVDCNY